MREKAVFAASAIALSVVLFWAWPAITVPLETGGELFARGPFLIPVIAAIAVAQGAPWRRRALHVGAAVGIFALIDVVAALLGLPAIAAGCSATDPGYSGTIGAIVYQALRRGFPLAVLIAFIGTEPSVLWTPPTRAERAARSRR